MNIRQLFDVRSPLLSFEVFPPKREGSVEALFRTIEELRGENPAYISVTYGAGGSTQEKTFEIAVRLKEAGFRPLVHLTCVGHGRNEIREFLKRLEDAGVENILALRGDPPRGEASFTPPPDGFRYASELIAFIRKEGFRFCLGAAGYPEGHPEAESYRADVEAARRKVEAGADFLVTQLFFNNSDYRRYVGDLRALGVNVPVEPGVWLLTDYAQIRRICELSGADFPEELRRRVEPHREDPEAVEAVGVEWAVAQCRDLLAFGAPGLHFYTMNKSGPARKVLAALRREGWYARRGEEIR